MIEELVKDYAAYLNLDLTSNLQSVQDVIDNMITRLEELTSVLHIIKTKNNDCCYTVTNDVSKYRHEITLLTKKIATLSEVISKLHTNVEILERKVEKAESDFSINTDNKLKNLFKPFLRKSRDLSLPETSVSINNLKMLSIKDYFELK